ncbi:hypothetical protein H1Q63_06100 [Desmonostoc muscorum CCALA 125]|nr:hypothetical protein [Desmonostoc muscorum CCALA 125]
MESGKKIWKLKGYCYFDKEKKTIKSCWVRDEHSDDEAQPLSNLKSLLEDLGLTLEIDLTDIKEESEGKIYFNILYRCDFILTDLLDLLEEKGETQKLLVDVDQLSGCDIAIPLALTDTSSSQKYIISSTTIPLGSKILLGLDLFSAKEKLGEEEMTLKKDWTDNHMTGKVMRCMINGGWTYKQWKIPEKNLFKDSINLYAGLLHGHKGNPLTTLELKDWISGMYKKHGKPTTTFVLFAEEQSTDEVRWVGLYQYINEAKNNEEELKWQRISDLVSQQDFWKALVATGETDKDDKNMELDMFGMDDY